MRGTTELADKLAAESAELEHRATVMNDLVRQLREAQTGGNVPLAQMRTVIANLGWCCVPVDALAHAERALREAGPTNDFPAAHKAWELSLAAVREALEVAGRSTSCIE